MIRVMWSVEGHEKGDDKIKRIKGMARAWERYNHETRNKGLYRVITYC
jgi:hypothetical protein